MFNFNFRKNKKDKEAEKEKVYITGKAKLSTEPKLGNHLGIETKRSISSISAGNPQALTGTFGAIGKSSSINAVINRVLQGAVLSSRQLSMTNPIHKKYIAQNASSVVGANGITYRPCVHISDDNVNNEINQRLTDAFYSWCEEPSRFSLNGKMEMSKFQSLVEKTRSIDGDCFIRIHPGMKIEVLDSTAIDTKGNQWLSNGNYRSNGIEFEKGTGKPVAYFLTRIDPVTYSVSAEAERVPAAEILHLFSTDYPEQQRGIPDIFCGTGLLNDLDKFMRASIKTRQLAAEAMGFITNSDKTGNFEDVGDDEDDDEVDEYHVARMEGGVLLELKEGQDVKQLNPTQTFDKLQEFLDNQLMFVGMSLDMTQQTLTGDTKNASFSAAKLTDKIQQNTFLAKQNNLVKSVLQPLYILWLKNEMLNNPEFKDLPFSKFNELTECNFIPQRHISLDPLKDLQTEILAMENGLKSKEQIITEMGYSPVLTHEQITKEEEIDGTKQPDEGDSSTDDQ